MTEQVDRLNLAPNAHAAALALLAAFPTAIFTSGRRGVEDQARAMSQNVVKSRGWIAATYRASPQSRQMQAWVDANPAAGQVQLAAAFRAIMNEWNDEERGVLSKHFSGQAFDVQPVPGARGLAIKAAIRSLPHLQKFLEREGGLVRWHAQFF